MKLVDIRLNKLEISDDRYYNMQNSVTKSGQHRT